MTEETLKELKKKFSRDQLSGREVGDLLEYIDELRSCIAACVDKELKQSKQSNLGDASADLLDKRKF